MFAPKKVYFSLHNLPCDFWDKTLFVAYIDNNNTKNNYTYMKMKSNCVIISEGQNAPGLT